MKHGQVHYHTFRAARCASPYACPFLCPVLPARQPMPVPCRSRRRLHPLKV